MLVSGFSTILKVRLLVGYLGERAQSAWWPTGFYGTSSTAFLEPVMPRTAQLARYHGVLEAARRVHDEHLNVGSYHLFRLPEEVEQDLHVQIQTADAEEFVAEEMSAKQKAIDCLEKLSGTIRPDAIGPTVIGNITDLSSANTVKIIASSYLSAFTRDVKAYPYLLG